MDGPGVDATSDTSSSILIRGRNRLAWSQTLHFSDSKASSVLLRIFGALFDNFICTHAMYVWLTPPNKAWGPAAEDQVLS